MNNFETVLSKIKNRTAQIGIIGFGTIGLNLAVKLLQQGFKVHGIDTSTDRISDLQSLTSNDGLKIKSFIDSKLLKLSNNYNCLKNIDIIVICIPVLLDINGTPDADNLSETLKTISKYINTPKLVILESTVYPGFSKEIALPILESNELEVGKDLFFSYSPERFDSSDDLIELSFKNKIVSGITEDCTKVAKEFYETFTNTVVVSSVDVAEVTKLFENTFRFVNISLINEFAVISEKLNINIWEMIDAASTKPFGFMPFSPSTGIGGDCIPTAPALLNWKLTQNNIKSRLIDSSSIINSYMPEYVYKRLEKLIQNTLHNSKEPRLIVLGVTYKKDTPDIKNSSSIKLIELLIKNGFMIDYNDIFINEIAIGATKKLYSKKLYYNLLAEYDCTIIATDHTQYDYEEIVKYSRKVFDTRNVTKNILKNRQKIILL